MSTRFSLAYRDVVRTRDDDIDTSLNLYQSAREKNGVNMLRKVLAHDRYEAVLNKLLERHG
jgi:hypothetical protein